ncbi:MAG: hypothetical protein PHW26_05455 [Eubacteriales bacterium]|nr:hypothetical protein [Eubacteriales bacterium]
MLQKKIDSWARFVFALLVFWAVLCLTQVFFACAAKFNAVLTVRAVQAGYITALRGICLLLVLGAALSMTALLRRGLIVVPLVWALTFLRFALTGPWTEMLKNVFFVSELLNLLLIILFPIFLALLLWQALDYLDPQLQAGRLVLPGLWTNLALAVFAGNFFVWHWSQSLGRGLWPAAFSLIYLLTGLGLAVLTARQRPWIALRLYFFGLLAPLALTMVLLGWYEGLTLFLTMLLPFAQGGFFSIWLELMLMFAAPILLILIVNQFYAWRRGGRLIEII